MDDSNLVAAASSSSGSRKWKGAKTKEKKSALCPGTLWHLMEGFLGEMCKVDRFLSIVSKRCASD